MKKLADTLVGVSLLLILYSFFIKLTDQSLVNVGVMKIIVSPIFIGALFLLAIFLMLTSVLIKISSKDRGSKRGDLKILFGSSAIVLIGLVLLFGVASLKGLSDQKVIERFRKIYYTSTLNRSSYLGIESQQYPSDNWVMQEMIYEIKPDFIVETGTGAGGTTLFYATILEKVNENGKIITVDVKPLFPEAHQFKTWREHVEFIQGSSVAPEVLDAIKERVKGRKVLVTLDSDHSKNHVLKELELYAPLVSLGSYIVVQDTDLSGHPNQHPYVKGEGPWEAVEEFLKTNKNFEIDHSREKYIITQYPSGFLKRMR